MKRARGRQFVSQYKLGAQVGALGRRWAQAEARRRWARVGVGRAGVGRWRTAQAGARGARGRQVWGAQERGARPGRAAGPASCALGALGLFLTRFDSVLFLSQILDIVREPGS